MKKSLVSVIIPAYNCEKTILKSLHAVLQQSYQNIEIIVIDDGSTDKTAEIIQSIKNVKYFYQENAGPAAARNQGGKEAKGEIIFFTDSDCAPERDWIKKMIIHFQGQSIAVVTGSYGISNNDSLLARCIHEEIMYRHRKMPKYIRAFGSYNFAVRKKVFDEVGGFDEAYRHASGEDNDLSYRILKAGHKIYFEPKALVDHEHTANIGRYLREQYRHGFWRVKMYYDHPYMSGGDDYTFYKDILEVVIVYLIILNLLFSAAAPFFILLGFGFAALLILIELFYGFIITKYSIEFFAAGLTMFLRAFARTFGLSSGILYFIPKVLLKKVK